MGHRGYLLSIAVSVTFRRLWTDIITITIICFFFPFLSCLFPVIFFVFCTFFSLDPQNPSPHPRPWPTHPFHSFDEQRRLEHQQQCRVLLLLGPRGGRGVGMDGDGWIGGHCNRENKNIMALLGTCVFLLLLFTKLCPLPYKDNYSNNQHPSLRTEPTITKQ